MVVPVFASIAQNLVYQTESLEAFDGLGIVGMLVGVELYGATAVGRLDLLLGGRLGEVEQGVESGAFALGSFNGRL